MIKRPTIDQLIIKMRTSEDFIKSISSDLKPSPKEFIQAWQTSQTRRQVSSRLKKMGFSLSPVNCGAWAGRYRRKYKIPMKYMDNQGSHRIHEVKKELESKEIKDYAKEFLKGKR